MKHLILAKSYVKFWVRSLKGGNNGGCISDRGRGIRTIDVTMKRRMHIRRAVAGKQEMEVRLKSEIEDNHSEELNNIEELNRNLDALSHKYGVLVTEKDDLNARVALLDEEF
ncbi:hypothetical protein CQW23_28202 [Capsicum baccatum]|uniref:Uncharacterized protein n=1 Tax=Capsicum baccatum TaxID=33114 RepID=A0A2G2VFU5_CAPBA|nr:hypothetical protein CQW23_28202 [Capsicum baccatum]